MPERGLICAAALALVSCVNPPVKAQVSPERISAERASELEHLVIQDCGSCHGLTFKGGLGSPLTPEALTHAEPEGLAFIILEGIPETAMPPWRPLLTEEEALWIANYLKKGTK